MANDIFCIRHAFFVRLFFRPHLNNTLKTFINQVTGPEAKNVDRLVQLHRVLLLMISYYELA